MRDEEVQVTRRSVKALGNATDRDDSGGWPNLSNLNLQPVDNVATNLLFFGSRLDKLNKGTYFTAQSGECVFI